MEWLRFVGTLKSYVFFAECSLFYRTLLQKRPVNLRSLVIHLTKKWSFRGCFRWYVLALSVRKRIFLKTKKADQKQCENWRVSLVQNATNIPECASEVTGENSCGILSLKVWSKTPLAKVHFQGFFGLMGSHPIWHHSHGIIHMASFTWHHSHGIIHMASFTWHHSHGIIHMASFT